MPQSHVHWPSLSRTRLRLDLLASGSLNAEDLGGNLGSCRAVRHDIVYFRGRVLANFLRDSLGDFGWYLDLRQRRVTVGCPFV